jgi:hypothetical protein
MSSFLKKKTKLAIVMDEIEAMKVGDKGSFNALLKMVRPSKMKRNCNSNPIICIGNSQTDKKINELMGCSAVIEVAPPTEDFMMSLLKERQPSLDPALCRQAVLHAEKDVKRCLNLGELLQRHGEKVLQHLERKPLLTTAKEKVMELLTNQPSMDAHANLNDTERTIVGMLWHENAGDYVSDAASYKNVMENVCFSDTIDRVTFQKQLWGLNEHSSLIKTFYANTLLRPPARPKEVRFTKILTKYSTEYNNYTFFQRLCQELGLDKRDLFLYLTKLRATLSVDQIGQHLNNENVSVVDLNRVFRFLGYGHQKA